ncbi:hypothetical protein OG978_19670 [Streptomyces sp. NBC_01591]|uniref:hypothetical protein n=1 Tax=Streptomyces sp. NBC_01591 TaxID=2975888 RepID=UPI002DDBAA15|nr:hypothetical protein [Streptomyces sp. NBC_01591]WSD69417.1 hypothetical protein OG978_19670 [Streptomyces sp. NBC_01591]
MSMVPPEVASFVAVAARLPERTLDAIRQATAVAVASGAYDHSAVPKLSAAHFSALNKQVRDAFAPRREELRAGRPGGLRSAISCTTQTAQVIWKRDRLTADRYASLTEAFTTHGVPLPHHAP